MSGLRKKIKAGEFVVTCELNPQKGGDFGDLLEAASSLRGRVDAFNVTDSHAAVMRQNPLALCLRLKDAGLEPVYQLTCRDRNRIALQSDLLAASALGIKNVLALTGDHPLLGDHREAKPVFDLDSVQLLSVFSAMRGGKDMRGRSLSGDAPDFFCGAVVNPGADPQELELMKMAKKAAAGAEFFQTQAVFDAESFAAFMRRKPASGSRVLAGILPLRSARTARYLNRRVPGVNVPERLIKEIESSGDKENAVEEIFSRLIREIKPMCAGIHLMPAGWFSIVPRLLEAAGR